MDLFICMRELVTNSCFFLEQKSSMARKSSLGAKKTTFMYTNHHNKPTKNTDKTKHIENNYGKVIRNHNCYTNETKSLEMTLKVQQ